jgi:hypothetical protein
MSLGSEQPRLILDLEGEMLDPCHAGVFGSRLIGACCVSP